MADKDLTFMQRILNARKAIMDSGIAKDKPGFKFHYVDLPQIEAKVNEACFDNDILCWFDFNEGTATLSLYDARDDQKSPFIVNVIPKAVEMKTQPIQDTGAMITYMRRYLYMTAFQISEHDIVDAKDNEPEEEAAGLDPERQALLDKIKEIDPNAPQKMLTMQKVDSLADLPLEYFQKIYDSFVARQNKSEANNG